MRFYLNKEMSDFKDEDEYCKAVSQVYYCLKAKGILKDAE